MIIKYCVECGTLLEKINDTRYNCSNGHIFWNNAKACVALVFIKDDAVLISTHGVKTDPNYGKLDFPGGYVDYGESAQQAAIREAKEELSVDVQESDLELIAAYHNNYIPGVTTVDLVFVVKTWTGNLNPSDDVASIRWKQLDVLHDPRFFQKYYTGLDKLLAKRLGK